MRKTFAILASAGLVFAVGTSCSDDLGGAAEPVTADPVAAEPLTGEEAAVATFNRFMDTFLEAEAQNPETRSATARPSIAGVRSTNTVAYGEPFTATRSAEDGMPVYELTLQNGDSTEGFAVVVENDAMQDVVAFVPEGAIADTTFNVGLAMWFREMYAMGRDATSEPETRVNEWDDDWKAYDVTEPGWMNSGLWSRPSQYVYEYVRDMTAAEKADGLQGLYWDVCHLEYPQNVKGPWLSTEWGQRAPYNYYMPYKENSSNEKYPVGCGPLAMAQIIAYHKHAANTNYNWDLFANTPTVTAGTTGAYQAASFMREVGLAMGAKQDSYTGWTVANDLNKYVPAFNSYGYDATMNSDLTNSTNWVKGLFNFTKSDIASGKPVLIVGFSSEAGHAFVVDGYQLWWRWWYHEISVGGSIPAKCEIHRTRYELALLHFNWGQHGQSNGWYYSYTPAHRDKTAEHSYYRRKTIWTGISPR